MNLSEMDLNIVRYGELVPCKTAFIDAHTPGSDRKENFTIIGGGVSESPDQHVHIRDTPGFNIGAAGQPPYCRNSLHMHSTAEVFFVLKGLKGPQCFRCFLMHLHIFGCVERITGVW